jgi:RND superfamily putative drug exporter
VLGNLPAGQTAALVKQESVRTQLEEQRLAKGRHAVIAVIPEWGPRTEETEELLRDIRALDAGPLQTLETGETAYRIDILDRITDGLPYVVGFVMVVTYFVLLAAFRSVLLPLKAVLMNVLSLGASLGIVVTVFQHGFLADLLQITSTGYVTNTLPVIIFCVVFGISMDYEVFLLSRIAEEYEQTGDNEQSTAAGLKLTGSLITSAAFILIVVVGAFIFTDIEIIKALGLGLSLAVLIDATIIRILVVPALMKLLGRANWWAPAWLKR